MQSSLYVALSAQLSLQRRLDTIAHNVANSSTAGFRAEQVKFESLLSNTGADPVAFASAGQSYLSRASGEMVKTDNPLDVAVQGEAWLGISTPAGTVYTRDGRMKMAPTGELQSIDGYGYLDVGGSPIVVDPSQGPVTISRDGMVMQNKRQVGSIGLFQIDERAKLTRFENSGVIPDAAAQPVVDFIKTGVMQGFVERSNVNPVTEMSRLIMVTRTLEAVTMSLNTTESNLQDAVKSLGSSQ
jgi:flagellar basal-body rod protein FlgF